MGFLTVTVLPGPSSEPGGGECLDPCKSKQEIRKGKFDRAYAAESDHPLGEHAYLVFARTVGLEVGWMLLVQAERLVGRGRS